MTVCSSYESAPFAACRERFCWASCVRLRVGAAVRHATGRNLWKFAYMADSLQGTALDPSTLHNNLRGNTLPGIIHSSMATWTGWQCQQIKPECLDRVRLVEGGCSRIAADAWVVTLDFIGHSYWVRGKTFWSSELGGGLQAPTG